MTLEEKREFIEEDNEESFQRFNLINGELFYSQTEKRVNNLAVMIDFPKSMDVNDREKPVVLKYGEYEELLPYLKEYSCSDIFNVKIIQLPTDMYKWVNIIFEISVSNWAYFLLDELKDRGLKYE